MMRDPVEVMDLVLADAVSDLVTESDLEVGIDAEAIAEAERRRSLLADRWRAAESSIVTARIQGVNVSGKVGEVGDGLVLMAAENECLALAMSSVTTVSGLPAVLRSEFPEPSRVRLTWPSLLSEWSAAAWVSLLLMSGEQVRGRIECVGSDHVDLCCADQRLTVPVTSISMARISR
jgi:hypothetical protein